MSTLRVAEGMHLTLTVYAGPAGWRFTVEGPLRDASGLPGLYLLLSATDSLPNRDAAEAAGREVLRRLRGAPALGLWEPAPELAGLTGQMREVRTQMNAVECPPAAQGAAGEGTGGGLGSWGQKDRPAGPAGLPDVENER